MSKRTIPAFLVLVFVLSLTFAVTMASDWPTYRHDIARTGSTAESLGQPLQLRWAYVPTDRPKPAWSPPARRPREGFLLRHRVDFDDAFQVAAAGGRVYFGSSADDKVYALSATTGEEIWSFYTGGPVRLAPTIWNDRVFVGSDDGFVRCLRADTGDLIWKKRGGPSDERLLGNGRMISRWPIRTDVLVDDGIVYFGAGVFPHENVYLLAVRADNGKTVWRNDTISEGQAYRNELSPQGYLLAAATRLFVPSGRALPVAFDKLTGRMMFSPNYGWRGEQAGGVIGGTYALLADNQIYTGTQEHLLALDQETGKTGFAWFPGRRLTIAGDMAYMATGREILALDRVAYAQASRRRNSLEYRIKTLRSQLNRAKGEQRKRLKQQLERVEAELTQHRRQSIRPGIKWHEVSSCDAELVVSKNLVLAGGQDEVNAFNRVNGDRVWEAKVEGKARGLAIADGHLYVSTDNGRIYCFASGQAGDDETRVVRQTKTPVVAPYPEDELTLIYEAAAEAIITESGVTKGYCLVLGAERGRLALELARRTDLHIIGIEPDPSKVHAARSALDAAGVYGGRVVVDQGDLSALPYSNYFANLIVSDSLLLTGEVPGDPGQLARHLKPCGGTICLGMPANAHSQKDALSAEKLVPWFDRAELGRCQISETNGLWATLRRGALPGAGKWTHQYANPGNTGCGNDQLLSGPLGLLWFGEPGPAPMVNRHNAAAAPLAINGRLLIQGENVVMAYDSYNGALLWKRDIPGAMRTRLKRSECGNLAALEDSLIVAVDDKCLQLDAGTGETRDTWQMPSKPGDNSSKWGYLAYVDGIVYGSSMRRVGVSDTVFAIDAGNGENLWEYESNNIVNLTIAIGDGWLFFVDNSLTPQQREQMLRKDKSRMASLKGDEAKKAEEAIKSLDVRMAVALDAKTGGKLWERPVDVTDCSNIGIGGGELTAMYRNGIVVLCGANANGHYWKQFLSGEFSRRRLVALSARTGERLWARDADYRHRPVIVGDTVLAEPWAFDLKTGEQRMRRHPLSGVETPWQFLRPGHHCGAISACPQMLLMRSGFTAYYDLHDDSGIRHFAAHRLGCWINAIPADGLALMPEASAGCICLFPIICSLALEPRADHYRWAIYSTGGPNTPVQHLAVNLGAPGDRRDSQGILWFGYPRPTLPSDRKAMGFSLDLQVEFFDGGGYFHQSSESAPVARTDTPWVFTSRAKGIKRCVIPLRGKNDEPATYVVRLYFAELEDSQPEETGFDIKLQGNTVVEGFDIAQRAGGARRAVSIEFPGIEVERNLEVEFIPHGDTASSPAKATALCGLAVLCAEQKKSTEAKLTAQR
ncbi:PQQ-binding-like beta-propeller repeat protein [bacterium]|nr:PQQ-binding-like beta-propeller repeat protein [bacterium]